MAVFLDCADALVEEALVLATFLAAGFFAEVFLAAGFFAAVFLAVAFFVEAFLTVAFFVEIFLAVDFFVELFLAVVFFIADLALATEVLETSATAIICSADLPSPCFLLCMLSPADFTGTLRLHSTRGASAHIPSRSYHAR